MNIKICVSEQILSLNHFDDKIIFGIFWEHEGVFYPSDCWTDYGYIIIGWWVSTIIRFSNQQLEGNFSFMDGPYSILAKHNIITGEIELHPKNTDVFWQVNILDIIESLHDSINLIQAKFKNCIKQEESVILAKYLEALEKCLETKPPR
jgi:hypothetical protein